MRKILSLVALILCLCIISGCGLDALATDPSGLTQGSGATSPIDATKHPSETPTTTGIELTAPSDPTTPATLNTQPATPEGTTAPTGTSVPEPSIPSATAPETTAPEESTFSLHFIDVGQADAALVECDGQYMLIDGGNKADSNIIYTVLKNIGVEKLSIVVASHAHEDHIGGLPGAYSYTTADLTLCPVASYDSNAFADFAKYAKQKGNGITIPKAGDTYSLGSATVKILGVNGGTDTNDTSIVLRIDYGKTSFLFTGDAEREAEQAILNAGANLKATVLKVGHHGSNTSTTYPFLREIMPEYAVISVGKDNSYGHPTEDTLSRLRDANVKVFRTDLQGDVYCTSDGAKVTFTVKKNADADTLAGAGDGGNHSTEPTQAAPTETKSPDESGSSGQIAYVLNNNSKKFHYPDCASAKKISDKNRQEITCSREELISRGYSPCGNCDP